MGKLDESSVTWLKKYAGIQNENEDLQKAFRFVDRFGTGVFHRDGYDLMKLNDDDAQELEEWLNYGLSQPLHVPDDKIFLFTEEGLELHSHELTLMEKAATRGFIKLSFLVTGTPDWESRDGQIAVSEDQLTRIEA